MIVATNSLRGRTDPICHAFHKLPGWSDSLGEMVIDIGTQFTDRRMPAAIRELSIIKAKDCSAWTHRTFVLDIPSYSDTS